VLREQLSQDALPHITSSDIQRALDLKPQLKFPFRLAVYQQPGSTGVNDHGQSSYYSHPSQRPIFIRDWSWEGEDKDQILSVASKLKSDGVVSDMSLFPRREC
jgi:hypothetical protein